MRSALSAIYSKIEAQTRKSGQPTSQVTNEKSDQTWEAGRGDEGDKQQKWAEAGVKASSPPSSKKGIRGTKLLVIR